MAILTRYLPEGYTLEGSDCIIRDGYVYVSVAPAEEVQNVKINYYDEAAKKQVAEVPVQVSIDTIFQKDIHLKVLIVSSETDMYMYP